MAVNYYIRALVYAHEGTYISQDLQESQFMSAELPFIIGTLKEPPAALSSPPISPQTSPALSAKSLSSRNAKNDPISSLSTGKKKKKKTLSHRDLIKMTLFF